MLEDVKAALRRVRESLAGRAEKSYADRDAAEPGSHERSFAEGEGYAYGVAESDTRKEEGANPDR